jgi:hypothetical protein
MTLPARRSARVALRMSTVGSIGMASAPSFRARLLSLGSLGRKSAGAAAMTSTSAADSSSRTAASSSWVVSTPRTRTPIGGASATGPEMSTTSAPRSQAASARR